MRLYDYIKDRVVSIFVYLGTVFMIFILLYVFNIHEILVIFIPIIFIILGIFIMLREYFKKRSFYNNLENNLNALDKKYLWTEIIKCPDFIEGKILYETLYQVDKSMIENINKYKYSSNEFMEYLEMWCHEIKTPIATSKLIIDNNKNKVTDNISEEIDKINNYVEQVLYYARIGYVENDYIVKNINLKNVIDNVLKRNKKDLINGKVKVNIDNTNIYVESDSKWLEFIINQIITNCIKYKKDKNSIIDIKAQDNKNNVILKIIDNGLGIKDDEILKVFDKGWTGSSGRKYQSSTGIGLYLCKKLCDKLNHNISITSIYGKETAVYIVFPISSVFKK